MKPNPAITTTPATSIKTIATPTITDASIRAITVTIIIVIATAATVSTGITAATDSYYTVWMRRHLLNVP